jgi:hypothetical protein
MIDAIHMDATMTLFGFAILVLPALNFQAFRLLSALAQNQISKKLNKLAEISQ